MIKLTKTLKSVTMDRRDFLKKTAGTGLAVGFATSAMSGISSAGINANEVDLVAIRGGEPDDMFNKAIDAMGGISRFVKRGQTVVVKPNIGWDASPERAANTNPKLVHRIIEHCLNAGAKDVFVFDHTCDTWTRCYTNSGIERAVRDAGGKMVGGNTENFYQTVEVGGKSLKTAKVHELIFSSDVFINVPVLKHHSSTRVTIAMKNLMGVVWDRGFWHKNDLHQCIADFAAYRKPDLNIVDAYAVMLRNGPRGVSVDDLVLMKSLVISPDMVAADAASTLLFGSQPSEIPHINIAAELKVGEKDLSKLNIKRLTA
jgi:uncharacterized protein (DUF362 family)